MSRKYRTTSSRPKLAKLPDRSPERRPEHSHRTASTEAIRDAFRLCRMAFLGVGIVSCVINILMLTGPFFMLQVYDRVLTSRSVPTLIGLAAIAGVLYLFYGLLEGLRSRVLSRIGSRLDARLSEMTFEQAAILPLRHGRQADRIEPIRDLDAIRQFFSGRGLPALFDLPWMPIYLGFVFLFHPLLGFIALAGVLLMCVFIALNETMTRAPTARAATKGAKRQAIIENTRANAEAASAMGMMPGLKANWTTANQQFLSNQEQAADRGTLFSSLIKTTRLMLQSGMLAVGAFLAIGDVITPGIMIAASIITARAAAPVEQAVSSWRGFLAARQGFDRLKSVFEAASKKDVETSLPLPSKSLEVRGISTSAPGGSNMIVQSVSFSLNAGEALGVIGSSGSGKSTLGRTLVGIWPAFAGEIRLDGSELVHWDRDQLGSAIGYLPQDVQLFAGTVAQNIARFGTDGTSDDVIEAARLANAHDIITRLPQGYDTQIGDAGAVLSGGQRQRIALARALYGNPFLIVLDEPNSNLDAQGDAGLTGAIHAARERGCIVIVIAHRPSAIAAVDFLLYMVEGRVAAFGERGEVLKRITTPPPQGSQQANIQSGTSGLAIGGR